MKKLIAGNWKLNGSADMADHFDGTMDQAVQRHDAVEWLLCVPYLYLGNIVSTKRGAQDCSTHESGAYTGEISATMLQDMGCDYCIVGHSERREYHAETDDMVCAKATQLIQNGVKAIICVGEKLDEREKGHAESVVRDQLLKSIPDNADANNVVIAYEPVWAIGTGMAATPDDVKSMHQMIRDVLCDKFADGDKMRILYGGSVKPDNAAQLLTLDNVDGALIGGASLKPQDFIAIGAALA